MNTQSIHHRKCIYIHTVSVYRLFVRTFSQYFLLATRITGDTQLAIIFPQGRFYQCQPFGFWGSKRLKSHLDNTLSQLPVVRSEQVRTFFHITESQEAKSEVLSISAICPRACHSRSSDVF